MSIHTSHSHVDHKALDSMLHNTLHMHHSYIHSSQSSTQTSSLPYSPLAPAPTSPALEPDHGYGSAYESDCLDNAVRRALKENRRRGQAALDLNMTSFLSSNTSSSSSDTTDGVETPLTSSATASPITRSSSQHLLPPAIPPRPTFPNKSTSLFLSAPASPTSTVSPTSPLKVTFSSPHYHRHDPTTVTTTFSSFYDQLSPHSKLQFEQKEPFTQDPSPQAQEKYIFEANTEQPPSPLRNGSHFQPSMPSFFEAGSQQHSSLEQEQHRPSIPTRIRTSMGAVSSSSHTKNSYGAQHHRSQSELNGHLVQQLLTSHQQQQPLGGDSRVDMIPIHVRYVPKDLWVQVDVPRDMPVHKARDLILAKCRLTSMPIQSLSTSSSEETLVSPVSPISPISSGEITLPIDPDQTLAQGTLGYEMLSEKQGPTHYNNSDFVVSRNRRPSRLTIGDDDSINDQESIDDEEAEMRAEELMADDMFPQSPPSRASSGNAGLTESMLLSLQNIPFVSSRLRQDSQSSFMTSASGNNTSDMQKQRGRLNAYSKLNRDDGYGSGSASGGDSSSRDGSSIHSRLSNIPGWSHYRNRQNSNNGSKKCEERETQDHCSAMADFCTGNGDAAAKREIECAAWKASFGLFWVAAGHWLDDSRLVSSYALQPHCLLELQLRNNYIQLPPPGSSLSYYDHYAEGVLYKMSKKSTGNIARNSSTGVWKERWVVLQGTSLLIYHKRRDMTKKVIELTIPLTAVSTVLPLSPRHSFLRASSCVSAMSTSMITLTISPDPNVDQLCFRATSESELNHWMRIFNSLNCKPLHNLPPPFDPTAVTSPIAPPIPVPPPLPPLPSVPPPSSVDGVTMSTTKRDRHHSYSAAYNRIPGGFAAGTGGWNNNEWNVTGGASGQFFSERKRSHTTQSASAMPSINPALLLNAAAAFSNFQSGNTSSSDESRADGSSSSDDAGYHRSGSSCSSTGSISSRPISLSLSLKNKKHPPHYRNSSPVSALIGSMLGEREPASMSRSSSIGRTSLNMVRNSYHYQPEVQEVESVPRQRTSTEPGQRFRIRSMVSQRNSQVMFRDFIHRSKVGTPEALSDIASIPENRPVDGLENALALEPGCRALLKSAMAGSSVAPLYSGYVWLYVPNNLSGEASNRSEIGSVMDGSVSSMPMLPSAMMKATNISMSKASGRYVKCFASINEKGQFQWVEVKKDDGEASEIQSQQDDSSSSHTMYGFQLKSSESSTLAQQGTETTNECNQGNYSSVGERNADPKPTRQVQASMSRKLRLYFFCIKISPSSLAEVMIEMTETPPTAPSGVNTPMARDSPMGSKYRSRSGVVPASTPSSPPPPLSRKSSRRIRNRFSAPVAPPASSYLPSASSSSMSSAPLPLLPSATMALNRSRSRSGAQLIRPNSFVRNSDGSVPTWPSMSGLHDRSQPASRSSSPPPQKQQQPAPPAPEKVIPNTSSSSMVPPPIPPRPVLVPPIRGGHHSKSRSLFAENWTKTRSAPPGSLFPSAAKDSAATAKPQDTISCVSGKVVVVPAVPKTNKSSGADSLVMRSEPLSMISSMTTSGASSSVVSLAQDLKKAMRRVSVSGAEDDVATASGASGTPLSSRKPSLSEITAKKRASLQNQQQPQPYHQYQHPESRARARASLERERSRLKLVGGLTALEEACETEGNQEDDDEFKSSSAQQKQRRRQRTTSGSAASVAAMLRMLMQCPFLEQSESQDADGRMYVTLKGYTETEEEWRVLQSALERFIDGPVKDNKAALPPVDTLIPSYHAPRRPDSRLVDKSPSANDKNAAATAAAKALLGYEVLHGSSSPSSGYATPPSTAAGPSGGGASLSRSSSITRSSTPVGFNRHSVQMTTGTGYGPSRSFNDLGQNNTNNNNNSSSGGVNSLVSSPMALPTRNSGYFSENHHHHHAISFSSQSVSAGRSAYDAMNSSPASGIRAGWSSYGSSPVSTPGTGTARCRSSVTGLSLGHRRLGSGGLNQLHQKQQPHQQQQQQQHQRHQRQESAGGYFQMQPHHYQRQHHRQSSEQPGGFAGYMVSAPCVLPGGSMTPPASYSSSYASSPSLQFRAAVGAVKTSVHLNRAMY